MVSSLLVSFLPFLYARSYDLQQREHYLTLPRFRVLVIGSLGGRLDHEFGNLHVLYRYRDVSIVLLSSHSQVLLLRAGSRHVIRPNRECEGPHCGLVPLGAPCSTSTTTGLKWNLGE